MDRPLWMKRGEAEEEDATEGEAARRRMLSLNKKGDARRKRTQTANWQKKKKKKKLKGKDQPDSPVTWGPGRSGMDASREQSRRNEREGPGRI